MDTDSSRVSVTAAISHEPDVGPAMLVKVSTDVYELNVHIPTTELSALRDVPQTPWERGALRVGTSANAPVYWSCDDQEVFVAVGSDDETWDFGVTIPLVTFERILEAIAREHRNAGHA